MSYRPTAICHPIDPVAILVIVGQRRRNARKVFNAENKNSSLSMDQEFVQVSLFIFLSKYCLNDIILF